jgi:hypothetical protein
MKVSDDGNQVLSVYVEQNQRQSHNVSGQLPQGLKPVFKTALYRSGEPLRHPKAETESSFSPNCDVVPQNQFMR